MSKIPLSLIAILSEILSEYETHATLDNLFLYADINSEIPNVSKPAKVQQVLMEVNKANIEPLKVLGRILEKYLDGGVLYVRDQEKFNKQIENIKKILSDNSLNVSAEVHSFLSFRMTIISEASIGIGSVGTSPLPILVTTFSTSGKRVFRI